MTQYLYIDNHDGFGPRDFTKFLTDSDQFFSHNKNEPQVFNFNVVDTSDTNPHYADTIRTTSSLVGYWRLGEGAGTAAADTSGGGRTLTYGGSPTYGVAGAVADGNTAITLPGTTTEYLLRNPITGMPTREFTVEFWAKYTYTSGERWPFHYIITGNVNELSIGLEPARVHVTIHDVAGSNFITTGVPMNDGQYHHFVITWRAVDGLLRVYIDGTQRGADVNYATNTTLTDGGALALGQEQDSVGGGFDSTQAFIGTLDEVALYSRVLSAAEIANHYALRTDPGRPNSEFVIPARGAYVKFYDDRWDSRHPAIDNGVLFTGYITEDPDPSFLGAKGGAANWAYRINCTSDEFLANSKRLPNKTYVDKTRGFIIKDLLQTMFSGTTPFPFNTAGVSDGGIEKLFQVDTSQKWAELVAAFADADGFTYYLLDGFLYYGPESAVTTYNDPYYKLTIDQYDPRFSADNLDINRVSREITNDVTVFGEEEPADTVREHFVSDGYQGFHNLAFDPFGVTEDVILTDDFTSDIDTGVWEEKDTISNYIQFFDGALNIAGGPGTPGTAGTARTVYLLSRKPIEMSGIIEFRDGEIYFPPSPTGTGIIGGLYTDTTLSQNALWSGWYLDCTNKTLQPLGAAGASVGNSYAMVMTRHYVLRRTIQVDRPVGSAQEYTQSSTGATYAYDSVVGPNVYITFTVDEINDDDPSAVQINSTILAAYALPLSNPPDYLLYAITAPNDCHYVTNYLSIQYPQQAILKVNNKQTKLGSYLDGGRAALQSENGHGKLAWYATPTGSDAVSYVNTILGDVPEAYWRLGETSGTTRVDSSGNNHTGTATSVTQNVTGAINSDDDLANSFNGSSSFISVPGFVLSSAAVGSIEAWFKTTSLTNQTIYSNRNSGGTGEYVSISSGHANAGTSFAGTNIASVRSGLNDGRWHHVVVTWVNGGGNNFWMYIDGVLDTNTALARNPGTNTVNIGKDIYVDTISPGSGYFLGSLDEVAIYKNVTLTASQVLTHYNRGVASAGQVVTIPKAGSSIELTYYRKQVSRARVRSTESIDNERVRYRDDGVRQRVIRAEDVTPAPRTSEECLALAQAYLNDASRSRFEGTYVFDTVANTPTDLAFWPRPGDLVECSLDLPTGDIVAEPLSIQTVESVFLGKDAYQIKLGFGPVNRWDIVIRNLILKRKSTLDDPALADDDVTTLETINQNYPYPGDLLDCVVTPGSITATQFTVTLAGAGIPADVTNYEVRTDDTGWGNTNTGSGYLTRFRATSHTFTRTKRDMVFYIRPYNAGGYYSKRSAIIRVACPTTNSFTMTGVTGDISSSRIRVNVPIPRDPDYAGIIVRLGDASSASSTSPVVYQGNGDQNAIIGTGVNVTVTTGLLTVDIPNPNLFTSCYVWVNTYNLLDLLGTAQTAQILSVADGTWGTPTFNAGDFTASSGNWTVSSGNVADYSYTRNQDTLTVSVNVASTSVSATPASLSVKIPGGLIAARAVKTTCALTDNGTRVLGVMAVAVGGTTITIKRLDNANFATSTSTTAVEGQITFEIQ